MSYVTYIRIIDYESNTTTHNLYNKYVYISSTYPVTIPISKYS